MARSVSCVQKSGDSVDKAFCAAAVRQLGRYKPKQVAPNRNLFQTRIEFNAYSNGSKIKMASVLVVDPIGKNTIKLIFTPPIAASKAAPQVIDALGEILGTPATPTNVGWIRIVSPEDLPAK